MVRFELSTGSGALSAHAERWHELAVAASDPFSTPAWLQSCADLLPSTSLRCATLHDDDRLLAAGLFAAIPGGLASAGEGTSWDVVAVDDAARRRLWDEVAAIRPLRVRLASLRTGSAGDEAVRAAFGAAGYGVVTGAQELQNPHVILPGTFEELLAGRSKSTRRQVRRSRRDLEQAGQVVLRLTDNATELERDLGEFLRVEASGWKGREGTAITSRPDREQVYRGFARRAAAEGWLRLYLLELDGQVVAGQLAAAVGQELYLMKTGFDEERAALSPGFLLTADVIAAAIDEGLSGVDMGARADPYKMIWTDHVRPTRHVSLYRGLPGRVGAKGWSSVVRPRLVALRDRARQDPKLSARLERIQQLLPRRS